MAVEDHESLTETLEILFDRSAVAEIHDAEQQMADGEAFSEEHEDRSGDCLPSRLPRTIAVLRTRSSASEPRTGRVRPPAGAGPARRLSSDVPRRLRGACTEPA